jgi:hypothetical protein
MKLKLSYCWVCHLCKQLLLTFCFLIYILFSDKIDTMSRTRKTRPIEVRMADKSDKGVGAITDHDHANGECTLPETPTAQLKLTNAQWRTLTCRWHYQYTGHGLCGCQMCTDRVGKENKRHERRVTDKKAVQNWDNA